MKDKPKPIAKEIYYLIGILILIIIWPTAIFYSQYISGNYGHYIDSIVSFFGSVIGFLVMLSFPLSLFFFIGIIYCVERLKYIRKREEEKYDLKVEPAYETVSAGNPELANRWEKITQHINSNNENDWKQAILEADIILDDILSAMGYRGESIGEKLKRVEPSDFETLNDAWEAHKIRNRIAHDGSSFSLNHNEAKLTIARYKKVFEEFYYI